MALSNDSVALLLKALKGITDNPNQCFTVYDVTKATRSLTEDNIRHVDVRDVMHTFYDQGFLNTYTRQPYTFWSDNDQDYRTAQLFVPPSGDPDAYDPNEVRMVKPDDDDSVDAQVVLQDDNGTPLITVGATPVDSQDSQEDAATDQPAPQPVAHDAPTTRIKRDKKRPTTLFGLITNKLTKLVFGD
jgi:hypothetical protein